MTGVHGGDEHEGGGEGDGAGGAGDGDFAILQGLAHDFQGAAAEFGQFIEEEDAVVGEADFSRTGVAAATEQAGIADGVMRGAKGAGGDEGLGFAEQAANAVDLGGLDGFFLGHAGHDGADAFGDHAFARAGRADHQEIVSASDGDFDGAFGIALTFDIGKVDVVVGGCGEEFGGAAGLGREFDLAFEILDDLAQMLHADDVDAGDDAGLNGGTFGHEEAFAAFGAGFQGDGEESANGAEFSIEGEFADHGGLCQDVDGQFHPMGDEGDGNGQVETGAFFFEIGGGEIDGGHALIHGEATGGNGGGDTLAAFFDGGIGQSDDEHLGIAAAVMGLDLDLDGIDADEGG